MTMNVSTSPTGPQPMPGDKLVHIIFVPLDVASGAVSYGHVSADGLQQIAAHVGTISSNDIVVFAGKPFHFAKGTLHEHEEAHRYHPETLLKLHRLRKERAVWWSERPFQIVNILPATPTKTGKADRPFAIPKTQPEQGLSGGGVFVARSDIPDPAADDQEYKITFTLEGEPQPVDPNMYCDGGN
jgi:hypothetical protein